MKLNMTIQPLYRDGTVGDTTDEAVAVLTEDENAEHLDEPEMLDLGRTIVSAARRYAAERERGETDRGKELEGLDITIEIDN